MARRVNKRSGRKGRLPGKKVTPALIASWPVHGCWINPGWADPMNLAQVVVVRGDPRQGVAAAGFLVDTACLGLKDTLFVPYLSAEDLPQLLTEMQMEDGESEPCPPEFAAALVHRAVAYSTSLGLPPRPGSVAAMAALGGIDGDSWDGPIEFGREGKPLFISGPHDDAEAILAQLRSVVGDEFEYVVGV
jgi:hypothetical protein